LARASESGEPLERLARLGEVPGYPSVRQATAFPGGILFTVGDDCYTQVWAMDLESAEKRMLIDRAAGAFYLPSGHLLYGDCSGGVLAVEFDRRALAVVGTPTPVLTDVAGQIPALAVAQESGDLLYVEGRGEFVQRQLVWVARDGTEEPINVGDRGAIAVPRLSADGQRLAHQERTGEGVGIWIQDLASGAKRRIALSSSGLLRPTWSPDGRYVGYITDQRTPRSFFQQRADGIGPSELALDVDDPVNDAAWSRSGSWIVYRSGRGAVRDVKAKRVGGDGAVIPIAADPDVGEFTATLSPDEEWVAYVSDRSGRPELYVRPFPEVDQAIYQVSINGGTLPVWAHSGRELFFKSGSDLMVVDVTTTPAFSTSVPRALFSLDDYYVPGGIETLSGTYDISPDDSRFVLVRQLPMEVTADTNASTALVLVENFVEEVKAAFANE
ncbi:MAG: TolB family protein, partial [Longimicrobiales bacterium]